MSGLRRNQRQRCPACGLHLELCVCHDRPRVALATHVLVVQHNRERHKPTNSARLLPQVLVHAELVHYAVRDEPFDDRALRDPDTVYFVLFPGQESVELTPQLLEDAAGKRRMLVILDGTWSQCSRMRSRIEALQSAVKVRLPPGPPSAWGVRAETDAARVCSYEACIRALEICEGPSAIAPLSDFFGEQSRRMLFMKGKAPPPWQQPLLHDDLARADLPDSDDSSSDDSSSRDLATGHATDETP